eukprot:GILJ01008503.1.p1 GENE.GILJ01008503.1~~GILJ01008503.1.p1  ORF type:complete len:1055 (+),score=127.36 GILJ01008503.1:30-3194(+)
MSQCRLFLSVLLLTVVSGLSSLVRNDDVDFWQYVATNFAELRVDERQPRACGASHNMTVFFVPSTGTLGKFLKVPQGKVNTEIVTVIRRDLDSIAEALSAYRRRFEGDPRQSWADAFVIPTVHFDDSEEEGYLIESMDYIEGSTLRDYTLSKPDLSAAHLEHLIRQLSQILYVLAHARFAHLELYPQNIWITPEGRLRVFAMDSAKPCVTKTYQWSALPAAYLSWDSFPIREPTDFTSFDADTCLAQDAYSLGVSILSLMSPIDNDEDNLLTAAENFQLTALKTLKGINLPGEASLRDKLQRMLTVLLDGHRVPRTIGTFVLLEEFAITALQAPAEVTPLVFAVSDLNFWSEREFPGALPSMDLVQDEWAREYQTNERRSLYKISRHINGLVHYMPEINKDSFPPGDAISTRRSILPSYIPNIVFRSGLDSVTDPPLDEDALFNIYLLQQHYRQKLVLQKVKDASQCDEYAVFEGQPFEPMLIAADSPTKSSSGTRTRFSFKGQPFGQWLDEFRRGILLHASLLGWDGHVISGGCLARDTEESKVLVLVNSKKSVRTAYSFEVGRKSLILKPPKVLVVGGGPAGLVAALEAKRSAAAVTVWEKRDRYSRMYCQKCDVTAYLSRFLLESNEYLKSVEETLAAVAVTVGVNLQFQREFLFLDDEKNVASARVVDSSVRGWWAAKPWEQLREHRWPSSLQHQPFDVLIAADGAGSTIRTQYLKSHFIDATEVILKGSRTSTYSKRVLKLKSDPDGSETLPIQTVATLEFFKHECKYFGGSHPLPRSDCLSYETGYDNVWNIQRGSKNMCFFEYLENMRGLKRLQEIFVKHRVPTDGHEFGRLKDSPGAWDDVSQMLLARYLTVGQHSPADWLDGITWSSAPDKSCSYAPALDHEGIEKFRALQDLSLFSMFRMHMRRADAGKFAKTTAGGAIVAIVGDATRDSFFPLGDGLQKHIQQMSSLVQKNGASMSPTFASAIGSLVRREVSAADYCDHYDNAIQTYIQEGAMYMLFAVGCTNEPSRPKDISFVKLATLEQKIKNLNAREIANICPFIAVTDS